MVLSVGGKTFIAGEYLALDGGPCLLATTAPRFELHVEMKDPSEINESIFHPDSPAGKLWSLNQNFLNQFKLKFVDPYQSGGFGASTAQFVLLYSLIHASSLNWQQAINQYRELAKSDQGFPPSGADLAAMIKGHLCFFEREKWHLEAVSWPFGDKDFLIVKTNAKLATHDHLKELQSFNGEALRVSMQLIRRGLAENSFETFILGLRNFREKILALGLTAQGTQKWVKELESHPEVIFAKGCGAMGMDVLFLLFEKRNKLRVHEIVTMMGLEAKAGLSDLTQGLVVQGMSIHQEVLV